MKSKQFSIKGAEKVKAHTKLDVEKHKLNDKRKFRVKYGHSESTATDDSSNKIKVHSLVRKLSSPGCDIVNELNKIKSQYPTFFIDAGRVITSILSQFGKNLNGYNTLVKNAAYKFWEWVTSQDEVTLSNFHYNSFLNICAKCHNWQRALKVLNIEMKHANIKRDEFSYTSAINACAYKSEKGIELFHQMRNNDKIKPKNEIICNVVISSCSTGFDIKGATNAYNNMKEDGIRPSVKTYSSLITCCEKCRKWELVLEYLAEMKENGFRNCPYAYSAAIGACGNCGQWKKALELFRESCRLGDGDGSMENIIISECLKSAPSFINISSTLSL